MFLKLWFRFILWSSAGLWRFPFRQNKWSLALVKCYSSILVKCCPFFLNQHSYVPWTQRYNLLFTPFLKPRPRSERRLWLAESKCGAVIARSAHSSLHLGVGLRILLATREISPFCSLSTATRPPIWDFITSTYLPAFSCYFEKSSSL